MSLKKLAKFSEIIGKLKLVRRSGWISHVGMSEPESVADHSFRCAILAMCFGDLIKVDTEKLVRMLLLHDIQEVITGDYDSYEKEKIGISGVKQREIAAIEEILSLLPSELAEHYFRIWKEFESQGTKEAILANDIDKIEMIIQALEYERYGCDPRKLDVFWANTQNKIKTPVARDLFRMLIKERVKNE